MQVSHRWESSSLHFLSVADLISVNCKSFLIDSGTLPNRDVHHVTRGNDVSTDVRLRSTSMVSERHTPIISIVFTNTLGTTFAVST